jgi:A/G-specific adenine glycosylase
MGHLAGLAETLPKPAPKVKPPMRQRVASLPSRPDGPILFRKRPSNGLLGGLHELPTSDWLPAPIDRHAAMSEAPAKLNWRFHEQPVRHVFTHFTLELDLAEAETNNPPDGLWQSQEALDELALPTLVKKLLKQAGRI